jgi:8-oxo-dGTP pyrophosphatase MutT (NUDIX family)
MIGDILRSRTRKRIHEDGGACRHAGVLVPLLVEDGRYRVLFTKRTHRVGHHKGQISFPGGAVDDEDDTVEETVLREVHEELGVKKEDVRILGRIDDARTMASSFIVHPFVGLIPYPYEFRLSRAEVAGLLRIPLEVFCRGGSGERERLVEYEGNYYRTPTFESQGEVIWGATAQIMENFMDIVGHKLLLSKECD